MRFQTDQPPIVNGSEAEYVRQVADALARFRKGEWVFSRTLAHPNMPECVLVGVLNILTDKKESFKMHVVSPPGLAVVYIVEPCPDHGAA